MKDNEAFKNWLGVNADTKFTGIPAVVDELIQIKSVFYAWLEIN